MDFATFLKELSAGRRRTGGTGRSAEKDVGRERWPGNPPESLLENWVVVARTDSTNRLARRVVTELVAEETTPPAAVLVALEQAAGRGRHGRHWESPAGGGVYASRLLPVADADALQTIPLLAAVGLSQALEEVLGESVPGAECRLKWPNDLMVRGRKIGGVLVESVTLGGGEGALAIIGFGVNYRERGPEGTLAALGATSLAAELAEAGVAVQLPSLGALTLRLLEGLEAALERLGDTAWAIQRFRERTLHRPGDPIRCRTGEGLVEGELVGFAEQGFLRVRGGDGVERSISSGEIVEEVEA